MNRLTILLFAALSGCTLLPKRLIDPHVGSLAVVARIEGVAQAKCEALRIERDSAPAVLSELAQSNPQDVGDDCHWRTHGEHPAVQAIHQALHQVLDPLGPQ